MIRIIKGREHYEKQKLEEKSSSSLYRYFYCLTSHDDAYWLWKNEQ